MTTIPIKNVSVEERMRQCGDDCLGGTCGDLGCRARPQPGDMLDDGTRLALTRERKPLTSEAIWASNEVMAVNAKAGLSMSVLLELARAIEKMHGIG